MVARTELVWTKGKKTTSSEINYAVMLAVKKILFNTESDSYPLDLQTHQKPGTKISLSWEKGKEWVVDAYIEKYFSQTTDILMLVDQVLKTQSLSNEQVESLKNSTIVLENLLQEVQNKTSDTVKAIDIELKSIKKIFRF